MNMNVRVALNSFERLKNDEMFPNIFYLYAQQENNNI